MSHRSTGHYVLERELGRGGMASVYLAEDTKHRRKVAIKVLDATVSSMLGADRFVREIRVASQLQHPHILALLDSGVFGPDAGALAGRPFYVMPFVADGSLRTRLEREGMLPVADGVRIAQEVASALDHAHRHGVVHRDIKPENILLQDGSALVADFGIALALEEASGARLTRTGVSLGTPHYMPPEQAAGEPTITGRADIYALGAVLYEMLVGEPPFTGPTAQAVVARVMSESPRSVVAQRPSVPVHVDAVVRRALEKLPADRFASPRELSDSLGASPISPRTGGAGLATRLERVPRLRDPIVLALASLAVVSSAGAAWLWSHSRAGPAPTVRFTIGELSPSIAGNTPAVSPDGRTVVFARAGGGLLSRSLGSLAARSIAGTQLATHPFISPDGRWTGFFTQDDKLGKVPIDGSGPPVILGAATRFSRGAWGPGDVIVADGPRRGLRRIDAVTGASRDLTLLDSAQGEQRHVRPRVLAGTHIVVFTIERRGAGTEPATELAAVSLDGAVTGANRHTPLHVSGRFPVGMVDGWLVYGASDGGALLAVKFDAGRLQVTGTPVEVLRDAGGGIDDASLAPSGTLVYSHPVSNDLVVVDSRGGTRSLLTTATLGARGYMQPRISRDGRWVAVTGRAASGEPNVWLYDLQSGAGTRLSGGGEWLDVDWSPDGKRIIFSATDRHTIWTQPADGSAPATELTTADGSFPSYAPDGRTLLIERKRNGNWGIWSLRIDTAGDARPILAGPHTYYMASISPDGRWLAYASNESGREEVYVRPFPGPGVAVQVSEHGGNEPVWAPNGRRLFYRTGRELIAATIDDRAGFTVSGREALFRDTFAGDMPHANYAVLPDGEHFVMFGASPDSGPEAVVVVNWLSELRAALSSGARATPAAQ